MCVRVCLRKDKTHTPTIARTYSCSRNACSFGFVI